MKNVIKSAAVLAAFIACLSGLTSSAHAEITWDAKVIGYTVNFDGDIKVYVKDDATEIPCKIPSQTPYVKGCTSGTNSSCVHNTSKGYEATLSAVSAAFLSGSYVTLDTDDATCEIMGFRIGQKK